MSSVKRQYLEQVLALLDKHAQRATYGAVGGLVQLPAQSVMYGLPKTPRNSWVVSKATKMPSGYSFAQQHVRLTASPDVIETAEALNLWLKGAWRVG